MSPAADRSAQTRQRLLEATMETIRTHGVAKVSARTIAATGGLNQALVFYHFGSVTHLLGEACVVSTQQRVDGFADRLDAVQDFTGLVTVARDLHAEERAAGNVAVLAQVLAAAQSDPELAEATARALGLWTERVEQVLTRLLDDSPIGELVEPRALAQLVSAAFIGLELTASTDLADQLDALERLGVVAEMLDGLGPLARRAVRTTLRRRTRAVEH